jgi:hypothetical protein
MDVRDKRLDGLIETIPISGTILKKRPKRAGKYVSAFELTSAAPSCTARREYRGIGNARPTERLYAHMMSALHTE